MLFGVMTISAQQYDELDLLGTWKVTSQKGEISNTLKSFEKITFGECTYDKYYNNLGNWEYQESYPVPLGVVYGTVDTEGFSRPTNVIWSFSIPNTNKLHVLIAGREDLAMYFVIQRFNEEELVLTNYTGSCEITLTNIDSSKVRNLVSSEREEKKYYSLDGIRVENPDKGIYVEKSGESSRLITK